MNEPGCFEVDEDMDPIDAIDHCIGTIDESDAPALVGGLRTAITMLSNRKDPRELDNLMGYIGDAVQTDDMVLRDAALSCLAKFYRDWQARQ